LIQQQQQQQQQQSRVCIAGRGIELMDLSWLSAILVGAGCLALGYCIGTRRPFCFFLRLTPKVVRDTNTNPSSHHGNKNNNSKEPFETDKLADILDDFKMVTHILSI
jgi:PTH2 family peptidyl-tRNA hydrolase